MSKILMFTDLHIHAHKKSISRIEDCLTVLEWIFDVAKKEKIKDLIFLGDLFHDRQKIDVLVYQKTFEVFLKQQTTNPLNIYLLIGNHDMYHRDSWDVNSVSPLNAISGIKVIDKPETIIIQGHEIDFMPHTENPIENLLQFKGKRKYLCGHLAVDGAILNSSGMQADVIVEHDGEMVKVDKSCFTKWDHTFLGHYHAQQKVSDNVEYIGSPLQLNFGESFQTKHICIFNPDTNEREYVVNEFSPRHLILNETEVSQYNLENNFVRINVEDLTSSDTIEMHKKLRENSKASTLELRPKQKKIQEQQHEIKDAKSILYDKDKMIQAYLSDDRIDIGDLDKNKLLKIVKNIFEGSEDE